MRRGVLCITFAVAAVIVALVGSVMADSTEQRIAARMAALYDAAANDVNVMAARAAEQLGRDPASRSAQWRGARAAAMARQIEERLGRLGRETAGVIAMGRGPIAGAIQRAQRELADLGYTTRRRGGPAGELDQSISFGLVDDRAVERIAADTELRLQARATAGLTNAARRHGENAVALFRSLSPSDGNVQGSAEVAVNTAIARALIAGDPRLADRAIRERFGNVVGDDRIESVRKLGNKIIEVGNATMTVRQYAAVVTRTRLREATEAAHDERLLSVGLTLGQINGANSRNFCTAFLGLIVSLTGEPAVINGVTFPPKATLPGGGPPFHPQCSKTTSAFDPDLSRPERLAAGMRAVRVYETRRETGRLLEDVG